MAHYTDGYAGMMQTIEDLKKPTYTALVRFKNGSSLQHPYHLGTDLKTAQRLVILMSREEYHGMAREISLRLENKEVFLHKVKDLWEE